MSPVPFPSFFPTFFPTLLQTLSKFRDLKSQLSLLSVTHPTQMEEHISTVSECCVLPVASSLSPMLPVLSPDCLELLFPLVTSQLQSPHTAMFSS